MFRRIFNIVITIPVAIVLLIFMVANRQLVTLSLDPTTRETPFLAFQLPMFVVIFAALLVGIVAGGTLVWWKQGAYRKLARKEHRDAELWHKKADEARERADALDPKSPANANLAPGLEKLSRM